MKLEDEIDAFLASLSFERAMAANTCEAYARDLRRFAEDLSRRGRTCAAEIAREDIVGFLRRERDRGRASTTRARRRAAIRMFLRYLKERHLIASDPSALMDSAKKERPLPRVLSEEEVARLLDSVSGDKPRELRDRAMLEVLYGCGLRVSELCAMKMLDFVSDGELLRVTGKGSKERLVPVGAAAGRALNAYFAKARGTFLPPNRVVPHVFLSALGKPLTRQGVFKLLRTRAAAAGIPASRISPHVLRHSYASHMLAHGADIRAIQELLGHVDIGTTQIYTHVDAGRIADIHHRYHPRADA